jgi:O-antigen ligase
MQERHSVPWVWPAFAVWIYVTALLNGTNKDGAQNLAMYTVLIATVALVGRYMPRDQIARCGLILMRIGWFVGAVYAASLMQDGLSARQVFGPRSFALEALVFMAVAAPMVATRREARWFNYAMTVLIVMSLSRTAAVVALLILAAQTAHGRRGRHPIRAVAALVVFGVGALQLVSQSHTLQDRISGGDYGLRVGDYVINLEGRRQIWSLVTPPGPTQAEFWIGHGPGAAVVGAYRARDSADFGPHTAAALTIMAVSIGMLTDNVIIYSFVMAPAAVVIGLSLASPVLPPRPVQRRQRRLSEAETRDAQRSELARRHVAASGRW